MAAKVILLSSSPPSCQPALAPTPPPQLTGPAQTSINASAHCSPRLPSPSELIADARLSTVYGARLKRGSRAVPVPEGAIAGFTSARTLFNDAMVELGDEPGVYLKQTKSNTTTEKKRRAVSLIAEDAGLGLDQEPNQPGVAPSARANPTRQRKCERKEAGTAPKRKTPKPAARAALTVGEIRPVGPEAATAAHSSRLDPVADDSVYEVPSSPQYRHTEPLVLSERRSKVAKSKTKSRGKSKGTINAALDKSNIGAGAELQRPRKRARKSTDQRLERTKATGTSSHHFVDPPDIVTETVEQADLNESAPSPDLDVAPTRKRDWTPPVDTVHSQGSPAASECSAVCATRPGLVKLNLPGFAFSDPKAMNHGTDSGQEIEAAATRIQLADLGQPRALQPLDPVSENAENHVRQKTSQKKPAKRPKTITELTIAPFRKDPARETLNDPAVTGPSRCARHETLIGKTQLHNKVEHGHVFPPPTKPNNVCKPSRKVQKARAARPKLLSPETFGVRLRGQDILFATASQLVHESPTYLRNYQQAIKLSEADVASQEHEYVALRHSTGVPILTSDAAQSRLLGQAAAGLGGGLPRIQRPSGGLWSADIRGADDEVWIPSQKQPHQDDHSATEQTPSLKTTKQLASVAIVKGVHTTLSAPGERPFDQSPFARVEGGQSIEVDIAPEAETIGGEDSYIDIDDLVGRSFERSSSAPPILEPPSFNKQDDITTFKAMAPILSTLGTTDSFGTRSSSARLNKKCLSRSVLEPLDGNIIASQQGRTLSKPSVRMMSSLADTTVEASKVPTANAAEVAVDESKFADDRTSPALRPNGQPKRPRGRPRKDASYHEPPTSMAKKPGRSRAALSNDSTESKHHTVSTPSSTTSKAFIHIDEIEDSEPEISPSPPRRSRKAIQVSTLELVSSQGEVVEDPPESRDAKTRFEKQKSEVFAMITDIVRAAPRTNVPTLPSWYEKILLYDPIVLEDFTEWLNAQGATYQKGAVAEAKQSILKAKKNKGKSRQRLGEEVNPVDGPAPVAGDRLQLEVWMVQKWCEAHSVCCIFKEGLRGGVKARY